MTHDRGPVHSIPRAVAGCDDGGLSPAALLAMRSTVVPGSVFLAGCAVFFGIHAYQQDAAAYFLLLAGSLISLATLLPTMLELTGRGRPVAGLWIVVSLAVFLGCATLALDGAVTFLVAGGVGLCVVGGGLFMPSRWPWWMGIALLLAIELVLLDMAAPFARIGIASSNVAQSFLITLASLLVAWVVWVSFNVYRAMETIRARLLISFVLAVTIPFLAGAATQIYVGFGAGTRDAISRLETIAGLKTATVQSWLNGIEKDVSLALFDFGPRSQAMAVLQKGAAANRAAAQTLRTILRGYLSGSQGVEELFLVDAEGVVQLSTRPAHEQEYRGLHAYFARGIKDGGVFVEAGPGLGADKGEVFVVSPLGGADGSMAGMLVGKARLGDVGEIMARRPGLDTSTECFLVSEEGLLLSPVLSKGLFEGAAYIDSEGVFKATGERATQAGIFRGYKGRSVVGVYVWLDRMNSVLVVEQDRSEAFGLIYSTLRMHSMVGLAALLCAVLASLLLARRMSGPLVKLADAAQRVQGGELNVSIDEEKGEMGLVAKAFNAMTARLRKLIADLEEEVGQKCEAEERLRQHAQALESEIAEKSMVEKRLEHQAFHDPLTDLANRSLLMERIRRTLERAQRRENYHCAVLFLDMDRFKVINDSLGHVMGDRLLVETAGRIVESTRSLDTVARLGGDEFVVLLEELGSQREAVVIAKRVREALSRPFILGGHEVHSSASIGVLLNLDGYTSADSILRDSNIAMHHAKEGGRNRIKVFRRSMHDEAMKLLVMEGDLRRALADEEFFVQYQPLYTGHGALSGFEALIRWNHPERGMVSPGDFISVAEDSGLIVSMGEWVLREACRRLAGWRAELPDGDTIHMAVNLSAKQFTQENLIEQVAGALESSGLPPSLLTLEITESVVMDNASRTVRILNRLKRLGSMLSVDDFGTGYSSLSYLQRFPVDILKIDRSFVMDLTAEGESAEIVRAIMMLAHSLDLDVVAEGVTRQEHVEILRDLGCEYMQGYLFSRPVDESEARKMYMEAVRSRATGGAAESRQPGVQSGGQPDGQPDGQNDG